MLSICPSRGVLKHIGAGRRLSTDVHVHFVDPAVNPRPKQRRLEIILLGRITPASILPQILVLVPPQHT